jgi:FkbM family methyltransferase
VPSKFKKKLTSALRARGWIVLPEWRIGRFPHEEHLAHLSSAYDIDCVLDVGANAGQFRDLLRDYVNYRGPIVSFEPVSSYASALKKRAASDPAWRIYPWALGSRSETQTITLYSSPGLPSLLPPNLDAMHNLLPRPDTAVTGTEEVTVRRLDEVFAEVTAGLSFRNVFLKLDTQGYDLEVIHGAGAILGAVSALQTELSVQPIYQAMPDYRDALQTLTGLGYAISGIFPVMHDHALRMVEMDCVMVRNTAEVTD